MHFKNFNLIMMLTAGIIVGIISVLLSYSLERLMYTLIVVLFIFFVIGTLIQMLVNRILEASDQEQRDREIALLDEEKEELDLVKTDDNVDLTE